MVRLSWLTLVCWLMASTALAQAGADDVPDAALGVGLSGLELSPASAAMKQHAYERLRKDPWLALGYDALVPGAGSFYTGISVHAWIALSVSVVGAGLWTAGAIWDQDTLWWAGAASFGVGRVYGLVAAPVGAVLLNAAFRRQLGIAYRY